MDFELIRYYDTACSQCHNWASGDINPQLMQGNKVNAEKTLKLYGWKAIKGEFICPFCATGQRR